RTLPTFRTLRAPIRPQRPPRAPPEGLLGMQPFSAADLAPHDGYHTCDPARDLRPGRVRSSCQAPNTKHLRRLGRCNASPRRWGPAMRARWPRSWSTPRRTELGLRAAPPRMLATAHLFYMSTFGRSPHAHRRRPGRRDFGKTRDRRHTFASALETRHPCPWFQAPPKHAV